MRLVHGSDGMDEVVTERRGRLVQHVFALWSGSGETSLRVAYARHRGTVLKCAVRSVSAQLVAGCGVSCSRQQSGSNQLCLCGVYEREASR